MDVDSVKWVEIIIGFMNNAEAAKSNAQAFYWIASNKRKKGVSFRLRALMKLIRATMIATKSQIHERKIENVRYINNLGRTDKRFTYWELNPSE